MSLRAAAAAVDNGNQQQRDDDDEDDKDDDDDKSLSLHSSLSASNDSGIKSAIFTLLNSSLLYKLVSKYNYIIVRPKVSWAGLTLSLPITLTL